MIELDDPRDRHNGHNSDQANEEICRCVPQATGCCLCCSPPRISLRSGFLTFVSVNMACALLLLLMEFFMSTASTSVLRAAGGESTVEVIEEEGDDGEVDRMDRVEMKSTKVLRFFRIAEYIIFAVYILGIYAGLSRKRRLLKAYLITRFCFAILSFLIQCLTIIGDGQYAQACTLVIWLMLLGWEFVVGISFYRVLRRGGTGSEIPGEAASTTLSVHGRRPNSPVIGQMHSPGENLKERDTDAVVVKVQGNNANIGKKGEPTGMSGIEPEVASKYV